MAVLPLKLDGDKGEVSSGPFPGARLREASTANARALRLGLEPSLLDVMANRPHGTINGTGEHCGGIHGARSLGFLDSAKKRAISRSTGADKAQKMQCLIAICPAVTLCLLSDPSVRFIVGVDYDLFHGCEHTATRWSYTCQSVFHKVSKILIAILICCGVGPPFRVMPNQRKQGKKKIGAWVDDAEKAQLDAEMKSTAAVIWQSFFAQFVRAASRYGQRFTHYFCQPSARINPAEFRAVRKIWPAYENEVGEKGRWVLAD